MFGLIYTALQNYRAWNDRREAMNALYALDDRGLRDIGLSRGELPFIMTRPSERAAPGAHGHRRPANQSRTVASNAA